MGDVWPSQFWPSLQLATQFPLRIRCQHANPPSSSRFTITPDPFMFRRIRRTWDWATLLHLLCPDNPCLTLPLLNWHHEKISHAPQLPQKKCARSPLQIQIMIEHRSRTLSLNGPENTTGTIQ